MVLRIGGKYEIESIIRLSDRYCCTVVDFLNDTQQFQQMNKAA